MITDALITALPKTDLHVHLDGSLREQTLIDLAKAQGVGLPSQTVEGMRALVFKETYGSLPEYLEGFAYTCAVLQQVDALKQVAYELAWDNILEGVFYVEVRFAPQLHMHDGLSFDDVLIAIHQGMGKAAAEHARSEAVTSKGKPPFHYGLIVCALRMFQPGFSQWYGRLMGALVGTPKKQIYSLASLELARMSVFCRDKHGVPIVGFDLAGQEDGYPASDHADAFAYAHKNFMKKTVHAGEAYGPESIFEAITDLYADRIGHGYHLFSPELCGPDIADPAAYVERLARHVADSRTTVEVCITSNLQTNPEIGDIENHVFGKMLAHRLSATLCTDNRLVSHTTVSKEYRLAIDAFGMSRKQLRNTIIYGFKRSFFHGSYKEKRDFVRGVIDHYDKVAAAHDLEGNP